MQACFGKSEYICFGFCHVLNKLSAFVCTVVNVQIPCVLENNTEVILVFFTPDVSECFWVRDRNIVSPEIELLVVIV